MKRFLLVLVIAFSAIFHAYADISWFLEETFESGQIPATWTQEAVSSNVTSWVVEPTASATYPATGNTSSYYVALRNTTGEDYHYVTRLIMPAIDFAGAEDVYQPRLIFKHAQPASGIDFDTLKVYYRTNATSPWTLLKVFNKRIDSWQEDTVMLLGNLNTSAYQLAFESVENMGAGIVLDDIRIGNTPNCLPTSAVTAMEVNAYDALLTWRGDFIADTFEVVVDTAQITDWSNINPAYHGYAIDFQTVVDGLLPLTTYYAYVRSKCVALEAGWTAWAMGSFTTREVSGLPYIPNLSSKPESWVTGTSMTNKPTFGNSNSYAVDSTGCLQFSGITAGNYAYAALPQMEVESVQDLEISFWGSAGTNSQTPGNNNLARLYVGVMTNPENYSTFEIVDSVEIKSAYTHKYFTVSLADYAGRGNYIAFAAQNAERSVTFFVSNIRVYAPAVVTPTNIRVFNITPNGFDVAADLHDASAYNVRVARSADYKHKNQMPSSYLFSQNNVSANAVCHVSGSYADSIVAVYVQAVNGNDQSDWAFPVTVRVPKAATVPLDYQFESAPKILLRSLENEVRTTNTKAGLADLYFTLVDFSSYYPDTTKNSDKKVPQYQGTHVLLQGADRWFALPYLESMESLSLSFYLAAPAIGQSRVAVGIMDNPYDLSTFTQLEVFDGGAASYVKCELDLDDYTGNGHYVAIRALLPASPSSSYGGSINHIDNLRIDSVSPCREIRSPQVNFTSPTSATLSWNGKGMQKWQVQLFDGNQTTLKSAQDVTTPSITFNNLTPLTTYYYQVNTLCGTDTVYAKTMRSFIAPRALPFSEPFESYAEGSFAAAGWTNEHMSGTDMSLFKVDTSLVAKNSTHKLMLPQQTSGTITRLTLPATFIPQADAYQFVLDMYRNGTGESYKQEGVRILANDGNHEVELAFISRNISVADRAHDIPAEDEPGWYTYELTIPFAGACQIILQGESKHGDAIYFDNLIINNVSTCIRPAALTVTSVGGNDAQLTVTPGANETQWQYLCLKRGEDIDWSKAALTTSAQFKISGLEPLTYYKVYLRSACSNGEYSKVVTCNFTTECGIFSSFPWREDFESTTAVSYSSTQGSAPSCWEASSTGTYAPHVSAGSSTSTYVHPHSGDNALVFYGSGVKTAVLPKFSEPINTLKISFWYRTDYNYGTLSLGYLTANDTTFHVIASYPSNTTMKQYEKLLTSVPAKADRLAFQYYYNNSSIYGCSIDDIEIITVDLNCLGVTDIRAAASSSTEGAVFWEAIGNQMVDVEVSTTSNFANATQYYGETLNPVTVSGLEANHTYYVRARQSCDTYNNWMTTSFKTLCGEIDVADFVLQDFAEGTTALECWEVNHTIKGSSSSSTAGNPKVVNSTAFGRYLAFTKTANHYGKNDTTTYPDGLYAILPPLDVDSINKYEISFDAFSADNHYANASKLAIGVITDPSDMATFTTIHSFVLDFAADSTEAENYTVRFTEYMGDYNDDFGKYVMFFAQTGDDANNIGIDNVHVDVASACPRIVEGIVYDIAENAVSYRWPTYGATSFEVAVLSAFGNPDTAQAVFRTTVNGSNSVRVTGLEPATVYYAYVRTLCEGETSRWSARTRFRTACGVKDLPMVEYFDDITQGVPVCWDNSEGTTTDVEYKWSHYQISNSNSCLRFESVNNARGNTSVLATPAFNVFSESALSFKWKNPKGVKAELLAAEVGDTVRTLLLDSAQLAVADWTVIRAGLSAFVGKDVNVFFVGTSNAGTGDSYLYLDSVEIHPVSGCYPLKSISAPTVGRREITVQLNPYPGFVLGNCELVYSETALNAAALDASAKIAVDSTGLYTISGLNRETIYYLYARTNCGEAGNGEWVSAKVKTKALAACEDEIVGASGTTTSQYLPTYSYYNYALTQQIYTPAEIGEAKEIPSIGFYNEGTAKTRTIDIYLKHTTKQSFASTSDWVPVTTSEKVFSGQVTFAANAWTTIQFTKVFDYNGTDNMLLIVDDNTGSYSSGMKCKSYSGANDQALYVYRDGSDYDPNNMSGITGTRTASKNQIKIAFCYAIEACPTVSDLSFEYVGDGTNSVVLRWTQADADYFGGYDIVVSDSIIPESVVPVPSYTKVKADSIVLNNLVPNTEYHVYMRTICKADGIDEGASDWATLDFVTLAPCPAVINLRSELADANAVKVSWETIIADQDKHFAYIVSDTLLNEAALAAASAEEVEDTMSVVISDLEYEHTYYIYVASMCDDENSPYRMTSITTETTCPAIRDLTVDRVAHNRVILSWKHSAFGHEALYEAGIVGQEANAIRIADTTAMLIGLSPETSYRAYVKAICSETESSVVLFTDTFTTTLAPGNCALVGDSTSTNNYLPAYSLYNYSLTQQIYTPAELGANPRSVLSLSFFNTGSLKTRSLNIYMRHTTKSAFATTTDWETVTANDLVFSGSVAFNPGVWTTIDLNTPFAYNGTDNVVLVVDDNTGSWSSGLSCVSYSAGSNQAIRVYSDGTNYDPFSPTSYTGTLMTVKNHIDFCFSQESGACPAVTNMSVRDLSTTSAVVAWEPMGSETSWNVLLSTEEVAEPVGTLTSSYYQALSDLTPDADYWFYVQPACGGNWNSIHFITVALCPSPISLSVDSVDAHMAIVSWTDEYSLGSSYVVAYGEAETFKADSAITYQTVQVNGTSVALQGLTPGTTYKFAVKANCAAGLTSRWSEPEEFHTACGAYQLPWTEGFESGGDCWTTGNVQMPNNSNYFGKLASNPDYVYSGDYSLALIAYYQEGDYSTSYLSTEADSCYAVLPEMDYGSLNLKQTTLTFFARNYADDAYSCYDHLLVGVVSGTSIGSFELVEDIQVTEEYDQYDVSFENYNGTGDRIALIAVIDPNSYASTRYGAIFMDELILAKTSSCARPQNVAVQHISDIDVNVAWQAGAEETQWQYVCTPAGIKPDWSNATLTDSTWAVVSGLAPNTAYTFSVRAYCSAAEQSFASGVSFVTDCAVRTLPFAETFENLTAGAIPECWDNAEGTTTDDSYKWGYSSAGEQGGCVRFNSGTNAAGNINILATPAIYISDTAKLSFSWKNPAGGNAQVLIAALGDSTQTSIIRNSLVGVSDWTRMQCDLSAYIGDTVRIYFVGTSNGASGSYLFLDNVQVEAYDPNCAGIFDLEVTFVSLAGATLEWTYPGGNHDAEIQVATDAEFNELVDKATVTGVETYVVTSVRPASTYYVRIRQLCGGNDVSEWSNVQQFTTGYGIPYAPDLSKAEDKAGWFFSNTKAAQVFNGAQMQAYTSSGYSGWYVVTTDTAALKGRPHFRGNIYGASWNYWAVSPALDLTPNVGDGIMLDFDANLRPYSGTGAPALGADDRFLVAVSIDGGKTWNPADVTEWNNAGTGDYSYNGVAGGKSYTLNLTNYAGNVIKIGFYGESSVSNADNYFHFGNINVRKETALTYTDTVCFGYGFEGNGFTVQYDQLHEGWNAFSTYEMLPDSSGMLLTVQKILSLPVLQEDISVDLCEGERYNQGGFDTTVVVSTVIRKRFYGASVNGCDSTVTLHLNVIPAARDTVRDSFKEGESYTWNGKTYYQNTIVRDTTSSLVTGCDSITILYLTMCPNDEFEYYAAFCGEGYTDQYFTDTLRKAGTYDTVYLDKNYCQIPVRIHLSELQAGKAFIDTVKVADLPYVMMMNGKLETIWGENAMPGSVYSDSYDFGCGRVTLKVVVDKGSAIDNIGSASLQVAPNPVRIGEDIRILTDISLSGDYSCRVYDAVGQLVYQTFEPAETIPGLYVAGLYTVRISTGTTTYHAKLIVR